MIFYQKSKITKYLIRAEDDNIIVDEIHIRLLKITIFYFGFLIN